VPQELLVQAGLHLLVLLQSAGAGQGTVRQPFLSHVVWVHWKVFVHVGKLSQAVQLDWVQLSPQVVFKHVDALQALVL
jgi:hypothetical protein